MEFHLVQNRKENCHHDHIPFDLKENGNIVFSVIGKLQALSESCNHRKPRVKYYSDYLLTSVYALIFDSCTNLHIYIYMLLYNVLGSTYLENIYHARLTLIYMMFKSLRMYTNILL